MAEPDLAFIARQLERQTTEIAALRDDLAVLTAIALGHDGSITALLAQFRATHAQIARTGERLRKLKDAQYGSLFDPRWRNSGCACSVSA